MINEMIIIMKIMKIVMIIIWKWKCVMIMNE